MAGFQTYIDDSQPGNIGDGHRRNRGASAEKLTNTFKALRCVLACDTCACTSTESQKPNIEGETLTVKPAAPEISPIRKFAQNAQGTFACGLYLNGKKVGYLVGTSKIVKRGDTDFFEQKMETLFKATKEGKQFIDKSTLTRQFNLTVKVS